MSKMILIFASMSGNTEEIAQLVAEGVRKEGGELVVKDIMSGPQASELLEYDGIILGSYTWGEGELPDDFLDFFDELDQLDLSGKKAAVFGSGDHAYEHFCAAVDMFQEKLRELGAEIVQEGLKIELSPTDDEKELCIQFGTQFARQLVKAG